MLIMVRARNKMFVFRPIMGINGISKKTLILLRKHAYSYIERYGPPPERVPVNLFIRYPQNFCLEGVNIGNL